MTEQGTQTDPLPQQQPHDPQPPQSTSEPLRYKNRLQELTQRLGVPFPVYRTINEGPLHALRFRSSVIVDGETYDSSTSYPNRKAAEQDAAKLALDGLSKKIKEEASLLIREDVVFCKTILNELVMKLHLQRPSFNTVRSEGLLPVFVSSLVLNGVTYAGERGRNKKEAEQLAARAAIQSILANSELGGRLSEIIKSKAKLYEALHKVKDAPGYNAPVPVESNLASNISTSTPEGKQFEHANLPSDEIRTYQLFNDFTKPNEEQVSGGSAIPITFVPTLQFVPPLEGPGFVMKRNRKNKKKAIKKSQNVEIEVPTRNLNQVSPCAIAQ